MGTAVTLLISSGLAVTISSVFGLITAQLREPIDRRQADCALAAGILTDETPNPNISVSTRGRLASDAALRADLCLKGR